MFFILGARDRTIDVSSGYFLCPACGQLRRFKLKRLARYFTVYFLPIFQMQALGEYIECQTCQRSFQAGELQQSGRVVTEANLLTAVKAELERGLPLHRLERRLTADGLGRDEIARLVHRVTAGQQRTCPQCQFSYFAGIRYCTNCGQPLSSPGTRPQLKPPD